MSVNKSVLFLLICSIKSSLSHENSEIGFMSSMRHCTKKQPKVLAYCLLKHSILSMERAIESNNTWHINDFVSMKKNMDWKPVELVQEIDNNVVDNASNSTIYNTFLRKATDLLRSRTIEFSIPQGDLSLRSGRALDGETGKLHVNGSMCGTGWFATLIRNDKLINNNSHFV